MCRQYKSERQSHQRRLIKHWLTTRDGATSANSSGNEIVASMVVETSDLIALERKDGLSGTFNNEAFGMLRKVKRTCSNGLFQS
jgi:hypothetical protein